MQYYAPMHKVRLNQMQFGQTDMGFQNIEIPNIQHTPWPVSQPMKQQKCIHVSFERDRANLRWPSLPSPVIACDKQYQQKPLPETSKIQMMNFGHQTVTPTPPPVYVDDALYSCNIIAQLQGTYEVETPAGRVQVNVILPKVSDQEYQYATVHRVSNDGKTLADQHIYDEPFTFNLQSLDGKLEGVLTKGSDMKHSVTWWNAEEENYIVWRRKGKVTFNIVQVEPKVRRGSISSICTVSTSPIMTQSVDTPMLGNDDNPLLIRPELMQQRTPLFLTRSSSGIHSSPESLFSFPNNMGAEAPSLKTEQQQEEMFKLIKAHCEINPLLYRKVVEWGSKNNSACGLSEDVMKSLSEGRLWITARPAEGEEGQVIADSLDDIKGAYQRASSGVYMQPARESCGSGVQHKLYKDESGRWILERNCTQNEGWQVRAEQLEDDRWIDLQNNKIEICVHIVSMSKILEKLGGENLRSKTDLVKSMDFLFTSCNQAKLSKLKGRNLKHHIANLKVKLEKRYALSFGVQIAHTAEIITQE